MCVCVCVTLCAMAYISIVRIITHLYGYFNTTAVTSYHIFSGEEKKMRKIFVRNKHSITRRLDATHSLT